jgi:hypothetical protein
VGRMEHPMANGGHRCEDEGGTSGSAGDTLRIRAPRTAKSSRGGLRYGVAGCNVARRMGLLGVGYISCCCRAGQGARSWRTFRGARLSRVGGAVRSLRRCGPGGYHRLLQGSGCCGCEDFEYTATWWMGIAHGSQPFRIFSSEYGRSSGGWPDTKVAQQIPTTRAPEEAFPRSRQIVDHPSRWEHGHAEIGEFAKGQWLAGSVHGCACSAHCKRGIRARPVPSGGGPQGRPSSRVRVWARSLSPMGNPPTLLEDPRSVTAPGVLRGSGFVSRSKFTKGGSNGAAAARSGTVVRPSGSGHHRWRKRGNRLLVDGHLNQALAAQPGFDGPDASIPFYRGGGGDEGAGKDLPRPG